jgi:hypothetical protein
MFGRYKLHATFINGLIGCLTAILLYRIGLRLFTEAVARRAMLFALFFPSMILWSSVAVKDTCIVFLLVLTMSCMIQLKHRFSPIALLAAAAALSAILTLRFYVFYMTCLAIGLSLFFSGRRLGRALTTQLLLMGVLAGAMVFLGLRHEASQDLQLFDLERVATLRSGLANTANSAFMADVDVSSPAKAIAFMPIGVLFLLFSPFPWQFRGLRPILTLPEMLVWWSLTAAWIRGLRYCLRARKSDLAPIICFAIVMTLAYSTVHGNVGVAFRQRSQIIIFLFLFAASGLELKRLRARGLPDKNVEAGGEGDAAAVAQVTPVPRFALRRLMPRRP